MKKEIVTILFVAFLFIGGVISLLADEEPAKEDTSHNFGLTESQSTGSQTNPCGGSEGNGGWAPG